MHLSTQRAENLCHLIILADYRKKGKQLPYKVFPFCGHFVLSKHQYFRLRYCFANTSAVTEMPAHMPYKVRLSAAVLPALLLSKFIWGIFSMLLPGGGAPPGISLLNGDVSRFCRASLLSNGSAVSSSPSPFQFRIRSPMLILPMTLRSRCEASISVSDSLCSSSAAGIVPSICPLMDWPRSRTNS